MHQGLITKDLVSRIYGTSKHQDYESKDKQAKRHMTSHEKGNPNGQ